MADTLALSSPEAQTDAYTTRLRADGYVIARNLIAADTVHALSADLDERFMATPFCIGDFYGEQTKRFGGLLKRSRHAETFVRNQVVLEIANAVLGPFCDRINLNLTQALELHPGQVVQVPHRDEDMWRGSKGEIEYLLNVMWPLTAYTKENGATLIWSGSHRVRTLEALSATPVVAAEMAPGDALIFLGSTLHAAGANKSTMPRRGLIVSYSLGWLKPYENQWLVYPPEIARRFSPDLAALVGYQQHRPNLGNYEGQCPSVLLREDAPDHLAAIDEMPPAQVAQLAAYARRQREQGS